MRTVRPATRIFIVSTIAGLFSVLPVHAQDPTPVPTGICAGGGKAAGPCTPITSVAPDSGASTAEIEAARHREAEKKRLEDLQQKMEQERLQREEEQKRAQEEFLKQVSEASRQLKGVSHGELGLKGAGDNNDFFGLKGVSPDAAAATINASRPDDSAHDVGTASKQLTCAADITNYALKHVSNIVAGTGSQSDLDEIKYLAGEAADALQGHPLGVQCNSSGALRFTKVPDLKTVTPAYKAKLDNIVQESQRLYETSRQAAAERQKVDDAKKRVEDLKAQRAVEVAQSSTSSPTPRATADSDVARAYAEQKAWQQTDQEKINQIYQEQKKLQQEQFDAIALLRKAQAELNAVNSQKLSETRAATSDVKQLEKLESGNAPQ